MLFLFIWFCPSTEMLADEVDVLLECVGESYYFDKPIVDTLLSPGFLPLFPKLLLVILWDTFTLLLVALYSFFNFSFSLKRNSFFFSNFSTESCNSFFILTKWSRSRFHLALSFSNSKIKELLLFSTSLYFYSNSWIFVFNDSLSVSNDF